MKKKLWNHIFSSFSSLKIFQRFIKLAPYYFIFFSLKIRRNRKRENNLKNLLAAVIISFKSINNNNKINDNSNELFFWRERKKNEIKCKIGRERFDNNNNKKNQCIEFQHTFYLREILMIFQQQQQKSIEK